MLNAEHLELADLIAARVEERLRQHGPVAVPEYLSPTEAAEFINASVRTLGNWRVRGSGGPAFTRVGTKTVRYHIDDLRSFMREGRIAREDDR